MAWWTTDAYKKFINSRNDSVTNKNIYQKSDNETSIALWLGGAFILCGVFIIILLLLDTLIVAW